MYTEKASRHSATCCVGGEIKKRKKKRKDWKEKKANGGAPW